MKKTILFLGIFSLLSISGYCYNNEKNDKKKKKKQKTEQAPTPEKRICIYTSLPVFSQTVLTKDISAGDLQPQTQPIYRCGNVHEYNINIKQD